MGKIRPLSKEMIGKIAAGEVVERPAAAVKELVENSLDAGATTVTVEIREGGLDYIRVTDNGCGIDESDIRMAFERHATSKIRKDEELDAIATLGFRGEALASIAAVAHVTLITRTADRDTGLKVLNEGGSIVSVEEHACPVGTNIIVTDLFYNTPVRKGFMKKPSAEAAAVNELVMHLILSRPDVSFRLINSGKVICQSAGDGQLSSAVHAVFGGAALKSMRPVEGHESGVLIHGFVGIGELARGNRNNECFFINGRMMMSTLLSSALEEGCRERVMIGKFPVCVLHLTVPYEAVDVNVHPNKLEVRFRDEAGVSGAMTTLVLEALREKDALEKPVPMLLQARPKEGIDEAPVKNAETGGDRIPPERSVSVSVSSSLPETARVIHSEPLAAPVFPPDKPEGQHSLFEEPQRMDEPADPPGSPENAAFRNLQDEPVHPFTGGIPEPRNREPEMKTESFIENTPLPMKIFGAVFDTFILIEYQDQLLLVDQHAVHERLLFDRMMKEFVDGEQFASQELLVPLIFSATRAEQAVLEENREMLEKIGLSVEPFGENDMAIRSVPMVLGEPESVPFVREIISELESGKNPGFEKKRAAILQTACKHAVKGGEKLPEEVLRDLVEQMVNQKVTPTCPHGRPLVVSITHRELDRKFRRIQ